jgi:hypothetical protein
VEHISKEEDNQVDKLLVFFAVVAQMIVLVVEATLNLLVRLVHLLAELIKVVVRATLQTALQVLAAFFDFLAHISGPVPPPGERVRAGRPRRRSLVGSEEGSRRPSGLSPRRIFRSSVYLARASSRKLGSGSRLMAHRIRGAALRRLIKTTRVRRVRAQHTALADAYSPNREHPL